MAATPAPRQLLRITVEGKTHEICLPEITVGLIKECRASTGMAPMKIVNMFTAGDGDLDLLAALIWLARRFAGERVTLESVEASLSYASDVQLSFEAEDAGPEA